MFPDASCRRQPPHHRAAGECNRASSSIVQVLVEGPETIGPSVWRKLISILPVEQNSSRWRLQQFPGFELAVNLMLNHIEHHVGQVSRGARKKSALIEPVQPLRKHLASRA